jgi:hypothetical protein
MWSNLVRLLFLLGLAFWGTRCMVKRQPVSVTRQPAPARPSYGAGAPCQGGSYVRGFYDSWGRWHYPHWRCPGGSVVIERD